MLAKLQIELLLAALSALLPLVPDKYRDRASEILDVVNDVTNLSGAALDLTQKLTALRAEIDAKPAVTAGDMDDALQRVRQASAAFRAALGTAAASTT